MGPHGGVRLDPLVSAQDPRKPLLSKLLAVPGLRSRYLGYVRQIAEEWCDWQKLQPLVAQYRSLIDAEVKLDTRKLASYEAFRNGLGLEDPAAEAPAGERGRPSLKAFVAQRRAYLLSHPELKKVAVR